MLWALLIMLLIRALAGGPQEIFQIPKLEKQIKKYVEDKDRKEKILDITKEVKKEIKAFNKFRKKKLKELKKKNIDRSYTTETMMDLFHSYHNERLKLQAFIIEKRLLTQDIYRDEEWNEIIKKAVFPSEKARKKITKGEIKQEDKVDEVFLKVEKSIVKHVSDPDKQQSLIEQTRKFNKTIDDFLEESQTMNYEDSEIARNRHATKDDLENFYKYQNELRVKGAVEFFELRTVAIDNTNDKEWKAIIKELNSIFK